MPSLIYLDAISAMPPYPEVVAAMQPFLTEAWGNPMSPHVAGDRPRAAMDQARAEVAALIGADPREIIFTASGSEANNLAVQGIASAARGRRQIIVSAVEHPSVLSSCRALEAHGFRTVMLPVDSHGRVDPAEVQSAITKETGLVSIQAASGEIGTLQAIAEIGAITRRAGVTFHVDAVAAAGRMPLDVASLQVDAVSLSSNQLGGPSGVGALYLRRGIRLAPLIHGGTQERGRRAGLEPVPGIVGMGAAARLVAARLPGQQSRLEPLRLQLFNALRRVDGCRLTGHPTERLPGHVSLVIECVEGEALVMALSRDGIAAATGVTCRDRTAWKASPTVMALGFDQGLAQGAVVFSLWPGNTAEEIGRAADIIPRCIARLRALSPIYPLAQGTHQ
jgi:cysteine desulfurase